MSDDHRRAPFVQLVDQEGELSLPMASQGALAVGLMDASLWGRPAVALARGEGRLRIESRLALRLEEANARLESEARLQTMSGLCSGLAAELWPAALALSEREALRQAAGSKRPGDVPSAACNSRL